VTETAKRLFGRIDAMYRYLVLNYQLGVVGKAIEGLDRQDRRQLLEIVDKKTQAPATDAARTGSTEAFQRVKSANAQLKLYALAHWVGAIYLETRDSPDGDFQEIHRRVLRMLRQVRDSLPRSARAA